MVIFKNMNELDSLGSNKFENFAGLDYWFFLKVRNLFLFPLKKKGIPVLPIEIKFTLKGHIA
ncbi:MAG: hypothetical protein A2007_02085 [Verrucomicrobia bacterium GWC2_42_7]|nr:MAG: hypothetical protein A2007_02085 [Verrucomicrobia bacterium GWC2_42_7]